MATAETVEEYLAGLPPETRKALEEVRSLIHQAAPGVTERISYAMPTFDLNGKYLLYLAGWKRHIGLYAVTAGAAEAFREELKPYKQGRGSLQLPLDQPLPADLIRQLVQFRVSEVTGSG